MSYTDGLVFSVLKGDDVCPVSVSYFSNDLLLFGGHLFLDVGSLVECMFATFSIIVASLYLASFSHLFHIGIVLILQWIWSNC